MIDGKTVASEKKQAIVEEVGMIMDRHKVVPTLRLISVGEDEASASYIRSKIRYGEKLGVKVELSSLRKEATYDELAEVLSKYSSDPGTNGIVLEAPLPPHINHAGIAQLIDPSKDVDCITEVNQGRIALNREMFLPATAQAIRTLIEMQGLRPGALVTIINRSAVIGRPLSLMLLNRDFTINVCHSKTADISKLTGESDAIVVGVGKPGFLTEKYVNSDSIVIDAGINYVDGSLKGDADFDGIKDLVKAITPVPGGVGPVTTACMFENLVKATKLQLKNFGR